MLFIITWKLIEDFRPSVLSSCQYLVYLNIVNTVRRVDCIYFPCVFSKLPVLCIARENMRSLNIYFIYLFIYLRTQHSKQYKIEDTIKAVKF